MLILFIFHLVFSFVLVTLICKLSYLLFDLLLKNILFKKLIYFKAFSINTQNEVIPFRLKLSEKYYKNFIIYSNTK